MTESLRLYVQRITNLPTIPVIALEILRLVSDDLTSAGSLEKIIQKDPSISAKVLSFANSAFFGFRLPTKTIRNAIVRIGFDNVKNIALGVSLMTVLEEDNGEKTSNYEKIFQHSTSVGVVARLLSKELKLNIDDEAMMSGMLHDIGSLVMNRYFHDSYRNVLKAVQHGRPLLEEEKNVFGFTHADIGAWLADRWHLPDSVLDVTQYHHKPSRAKRNVKHVAVTHIADHVITRDIASATGHDPDYPFDPSSLEILSISEGEFNDLAQKISKNVIF